MSDTSMLIAVKLGNVSYKRRRTLSPQEVGVLRRLRRDQDEDPADALNSLLGTWLESFCQRCYLDYHETKDCINPPRCGDCDGLHDVGKPCFENGAVR